ncbi:MAG: hypothetical protein QOI02_823 [Actinomycetota bacterium]|jgi:hypothetical protein|nr:hypothetical protein [Actinomycetota bacterium]
MTDETLPKPNYTGRVVDAQLQLLDRQVIDDTGKPVCVVDDIEVAGIELGQRMLRDAPAPTIDALLSGPVFLTRVFGGRPPTSRLFRIPWAKVRNLGTAIELSVGSESLDASWTERWTRDHVIGRIPGARHDPE